jgi:hypothetical protein
MNQVGMPEIFVVLFIAVMWLVPLAAGIWALVTLYRIRGTQQVLSKLEVIERCFSGDVYDSILISSTSNTSMPCGAPAAPA